MADPDTLESTEPAELPFTGLDNAFVIFLNDAQPSSDARHGQLAAMTSRQFGRGHACLDLEPLPADLRAAVLTIPWIAGANSPLVAHA